VAGEQRELLQEHRPLAPRRGLEDVEAPVAEADRLLDGRLVGREILRLEEGRQVVAGRAGLRVRPRRRHEALDLLGDPAPVELLARRLEGFYPAARSMSRLRIEQVLHCVRPSGEAHDLPDLRHAGRQEDLRRARPAVQPRLELDELLAQRRVHREPVARELDDRPERLLQPERAGLPERRDERADRRRHRRRDQPLAGDVDEPELADPLDRHAPRRPPLSADDKRVRLGGTPRLVDEDRALAPDAALLRLDKCQSKRCGDPAIGRVPASPKHLEPDLRGEVMPRGDNPAACQDRWPGHDRLRVYEEHCVWQGNRPP
jgi:hypothetical protein